MLSGKTEDFEKSSCQGMTTETEIRRMFRAPEGSIGQGVGIITLLVSLSMVMGYVASNLAQAQPNSYRGVVIAPENRCSPYVRHRDYTYPQSIEDKIIERQGGIYGPYEDRCFAAKTDTDIEHLVAASEAHDSGLCAAPREVRTAFANDLLNLTLASPYVNRYAKSGKDAGEWMPDENRCFFARRTLRVKRKYGLTMDEKEYRAIKEVIQQCRTLVGNGVGLPPNPCPDAEPEKVEITNPPSPNPSASALDLYDDNGNGRITCSEARAHNIAPVKRGHPAYQYMRDANGDGIVC